jgi:hypothetical protein
MFTEGDTSEQSTVNTCVSIGCRFVPAPTLPHQPSVAFVELLRRLLLMNAKFDLSAQSVPVLQRQGGV